MDAFAIGVDLGGTNLRIAAVSADGTLLEKISSDTDVARGRDYVIDDMCRSISNLTNRFGASRRFTGIGIGVPGIIDLQTGMVCKAQNLPDWRNYPVKQEIERRLGTAVILENDANAACLGEKWLGAGMGVDDLCMLTLGTGVGGGMVLQKRIWHGMTGMAGELGHISVDPDGIVCGCGNQGCLEKHASATAVTAMARLMQLGEELSSREVFELAQLTGEAGEKARTIWRVVGEMLGIALATLINAFNFPLYLLSGGMLPAWEFFEPHMVRTVRERSFTFRATPNETHIAQATLGNEAGLYGAAYLPWIEK